MGVPFDARFLVEGLGRPPGWFYFHTAGRELFGKIKEQQIDEAAGLLREVFRPKNV
jgi:hypothetical protein